MKEGANEQQANHFELKDYLIHGLYFFVYGFVKYVPPPIGSVLRYWATKPFIRKIGKARMYEGVTIWYPHRVSIGSNVSLNEWVYLSGFGSLTIGSDVRIGHRSSIMTSDHIIPEKGKLIRKAGISSAEVRIHDDVFIGANVTVLKGVSIGTGAVVGAGAVVTKNVPDYAVVAGNPARIISHRD